MLLSHRSGLQRLTSRVCSKGRLVAVCVLALAAPLSAQNAGDSPARVGEKAPPISIDALTNAPAGTDATWERLGPGTTAIEFWGTWCAPCVAAIPHINELHERFAPKGVRFLSVTYEEPALIETFRQRMPMSTWIGHDMDKSMVKDYGVRGWPTTFVVRDGIIVARTHPNSLTAERLEALVLGKEDPHTDRERLELPASVRPIMAEGAPAPTAADVPMRIEWPGLDPYSRASGERPALQVIVRKPAGEHAMSSSGSGGSTMLGQPMSQIIAGAWGVRQHTMRFENIPDEVLNQRFDVIFRVPEGRAEALMPMVREMVAEGLGIRVELERREVDGYALHLPETGAEGVRLEPGVGERAGLSSSSDGTTRTFTSSSMEHDTLVANLGGVLGAPIEDKTGLDGRYFVKLTLPMDPKKAPEAIERATGFRLVPVKTHVEMLVVRPRD